MQLPESLEIRLREGRVIPFVGAGFSMSVNARNGEPLFPSWTGLLSTAAKQLKREHKENDSALVSALVQKGDLIDAARRAKEGLGPARWYDFLKKIFDRTVDEADPQSLSLNGSVWSLGSNLVITTNYDRVLQWTCPDRADFRVWDIDAKVEQIDALREREVRRPTVWHLHGQIDNAAEMVLTPDGYTQLYGENESVYKAARETLRSILKTHTLVFLGFSLRDAAFVRELVEIDVTYKGAASHHYILLPECDAERADLKGTGVEVISYSNSDDLHSLLSKMATRTSESASTHVTVQRYLVDRREGIHMFGGRGDAFFQLYDKALGGLQQELDIFSLKLSRFRTRHGGSLLEHAKTVNIRIAILDPCFPLPKDNCSIASIREREEEAQSGAIMRDVAKWCDLFERYEEMCATGQLCIEEGAGLHIHLYNALPTINLFRADSSLFVGPYLLGVEDRDTPTFLIRGDAQERSMGKHLFDAYQAHFEAVWHAASTRSIRNVSEQERADWARGSYAETAAGN